MPENSMSLRQQVVQLLNDAQLAAPDGKLTMLADVVEKIAEREVSLLEEFAPIIAEFQVRAALRSARAPAGGRRAQVAHAAPDAHAALHSVIRMLTCGVR